MNAPHHIAPLYPQVILDDSGKVLYVNQAFLDWTKLDAQAILYKDFPSLIDDHQKTFQNVKKTGIDLAVALHRKTIFFKNNLEKVLIGECFTYEQSMLEGELKHIFISIRSNEYMGEISQPIPKNDRSKHELLNTLPYQVLVVSQRAPHDFLYKNTLFEKSELYQQAKDTVLNKLLQQCEFNEKFEYLQKGGDVSNWQGIIEIERMGIFYLKVKMKPYLYADKKAIILFIEEQSVEFQNATKTDTLQGQLNLLQHTVGAGLWQYNIQTKELWWSEGVFSLLGLSSEVYRPSMKVLLDYVHPDDLQSVLSVIERVKPSAKKQEVNFRINASHGIAHLKILADKTPQYDAYTGQVLLHGVICKLSSDNLLAQEVECLTYRYKHIVDTSKIGTWEWDLLTGEFNWSETCNHFFEEENEASINQSFTKYVHPFEHKKVIQALEEVQQGKDREVSFSFLKGDLQHYIQMKVIPVEFSQGSVSKVLGFMKDQTEIKTLEDELNHYQYLSQNVADAIISTNIDLRIRTWNSAAEKIYGWSAKEAIGKPVKELLFDSNISPRLFQDFSKKIGSVGEWRGEMEQLDRYGNKLFIHSSTRMMKDLDNNLIGLVMVNKNMTNVIATNKKLDDYSQKLEVMFQNTPGYIFLIDLQMRIVGHNTNFQRLLRSENDFVGLLLTELPIDDKQGLENSIVNVQRVIANEQPEYKVSSTIQLYNQTLWTSADYVPIKNKKGVITGVHCTINDITERALFENKIKESQTNLSAIIENANYALCYTDGDYNLKSYNKAFEKFYTNFLGQQIAPNANCLNGIPTAWRDALSEIFEYVMLGKQLNTEREMVINDEFRWFEFVCNPVMHQDDIMGLCLSIRDIQQRKKNEELLLRTKLHEAKIRSLATIQGQEDERNRVSMDLHDGVGQILTALQMQSNYIQTKSFESEEQLNAKLSRLDELVKAAKQEVRRISFNLMPRMLKDFGLEESVKSLCKMAFDDQSDIFCHLEISSPEERFSFEVEIGLFRVLQEVFNNILKYSEADAVNVRIFTTENEIHASISDNGIGFDYEQVVNKASDKNGLKNIRHRISILGGSISIRTKPGSGCSYSIIIPLSNVEVADSLMN